ncbi:PREDICTED: putative phospholipase B-like 2 isoform X1 [Papilio xuthus]|uniref:Phospholipase B-like n=1 Tax=Papilio xuthus TaxID=66420 RepID=A0AAJ6ZET8_PAPXU|nr:PREDICTED: putative phospholipase B-like 2 isoform X1 [Papilio xuthus]
MKIYWRCCLLLITTVSTCETKYGYVTWQENKLTFKECESASQIPISYGARATFKNEINSTGWAFLELHTSKDVTDEQQAYAAGFIEGYLTRDLIWMHWQNMLKGYCYNKTDLCGLIEEFIEKNENYIASMVDLNEIDAYWYQVKLYYIQLEGLAVGYNQATSDPYQWLTARDMVWINMLGDLDDLAFSLALPKDLPDGLLFGDHCTGLIKLLPDFRNLYTSHATWNSYQSMLRLQKMYVLHYKVSPLDKKRIPGYKMAFTSYPAFVQYMSALRQSTDDFYIISTGLVAGETTISNSNKTLFDLINPLCVMEYIRGMIANRLAVDGYQWTRIFRQHNSGTYNNQWYIVDYNKFTPSSKVCKGKAEKGLLWVIEQLPGYTEAADLTEQLVNTTYFPSYNIPYFPTIFNLSGGNVRVATFGDWFGYKTNPRANILKEKQAGITNLKDMFNTMRYNDFKHDPLSRCACVPPYSACNAIAARNDLNPANGTFPFRALGHRSHGATDAKVTSWHLRKNYEFVAVSGPTFNISRGIPPFAWSEFDMGPHLPHIGHPDVWAFQPIIHHWEWT